MLGRAGGRNTAFARRPDFEYNLTGSWIWRQRKRLMNVAMNNAWLIILLGIASTTQTHLAKALERQGIETWDLIRARFQRTEIEGKVRKPLIYVVGLTLNHTTFIYHLFVAPLGGTTALYTGMYGMGMIALLLYSTQVMAEKITRLELAGAVAILLGTLTIGLEGISRPALNMGRMDLGSTVVAVLLLLGLCLVLIVVGLKNGTPKLIGLVFGLSAGVCGSLDPFLKGVGQTAGGGGPFTPGSIGGWVVLGSSFIVGEAAVLITQWGFYRRARANLLVPAHNCTYVAVPVALQVLLLPGYQFYWSTGLGLVLILAGFVCMRGFGRRGTAASDGVPIRSGGNR
jgi:hypothetical protein